jgi:hypothetical protein
MDPLVTEKTNTKWGYFGAHTLVGENGTLSPEFTSTELSGTCDTHEKEEERNFTQILVGKPEGKRPLERPRRRWKDRIRVGVKEVG